MKFEIEAKTIHFMLVLAVALILWVAGKPAPGREAKIVNIRDIDREGFKASA